VVEIINFKDDAKMLEEELATRDELFIETGIEEWDANFRGLQRGALQIIAAASGQGKTTFLLCMAREIAKQGWNVLFVGTEDETSVLYRHMGPVNLDYVLLPYGQFIDQELKDIASNYDVLIYDYIGANGCQNTNVDQWQDLLYQTGVLDQFAKDQQVAILTAIQADDQLLEVLPQNIPETKKYVSFSKHVIDKVTVACYLKKENDKVWLKCFKNRYGMMPHDLMLFEVDYAKKKFRTDIFTRNR